MTTNRLGGESLNEDTDYRGMSMADSMHAHLPVVGANNALRQVADALGLKVPDVIGHKDPDTLAAWMVQALSPNVFHLRPPTAGMVVDHALRHPHHLDGLVASRWEVHRVTAGRVTRGMEALRPDVIPRTSDSGVLKWTREGWVPFDYEGVLRVFPLRSDGMYLTKASEQ